MLKFTLSLLILTAINFSVNAQINFPKIRIHTLVNFTGKDSTRLYEEIELLETKVLGNQKFWNDLKTADFKCRNRRIYHNDRSESCKYPVLPKDKHSYTNDEIHDLLFFGDDEIGSSKDGLIDLNLSLLDNLTGVTGAVVYGRTSTCSLTITSSRSKRLHLKEKGGYATHILHEYMHILGFKHKRNKPNANHRRCKGCDVAWTVQRFANFYMFGEYRSTCD